MTVPLREFHGNINTGFHGNLAPVILGNLVGGSVLVGLVYHVIYRRGSPQTS